ncbi:MAG: hypothetical protein OEZ59_10210 [Deltaproteobacteria bacterium]|nr:hypothetical protein [Deltaproteobacteria bacterium]
MIIQQLKQNHAIIEPVAAEIVSLMDARFRQYSEIRYRFLDGLPEHLLQSELVSFINVEIKEALFNESFCQGIQEALKALRRAIIRLEDLRATHRDIPSSIVDLKRLSELSEEVEGLYQKHWEYYRYKGRLSEEELVGLLLDIDRIGYHWDMFISRFAGVSDLAKELSMAPLREGIVPLQISYQIPAPDQFSVTMLAQVMDFLQSGYEFVCAVTSVDPKNHQLSLLQIDISSPVLITLGIHQGLAKIFRRFLHYLFLQDMLKRDTLLKIVFEAIGKDAGAEKKLPPAQVTGFIKKLSGHLKNLPENGRFNISGKIFPDDRIQVLQEFTRNLDMQNIKYDALLRDGKSGKSTPRARTGAEADNPPPAPRPADVPAPPQREEVIEPPPRRISESAVPGKNIFSNLKKDHISVLTEKGRS